MKWDLFSGLFNLAVGSVNFVVGATDFGPVGAFNLLIGAGGFYVAGLCFYDAWRHSHETVA